MHKAKLGCSERKLHVAMNWAVRVVAVLVGVCGAVLAGDHQYCVIGAGPGGLQMGYFLQSARRDYVIFDKNSTIGSFFTHYPRHRTLISINKRHTGSSNDEFNFRHDWNSLISDQPSLYLKHYTKKYFPPADAYVQYLNDYASQLNLNVQLDTNITSIDRQSNRFILTDQTGSTHHCTVLIISTGLWVPNIPKFDGVELAHGYEDVSIDPDDYEGKTVLIIGRGNAGFETASHIVGSTAFIHMASRSRIKMAYQTHYVGDLRAINDELIDTYQLKSLDGQTEGMGGEDDESVTLSKGADGKVYLQPADMSMIDENDIEATLGFNVGYDYVIRCTGFKFDYSPFSSSTKPGPFTSKSDKYPSVEYNYETTGIPNMFIAGTAAHTLDYRSSAGGFIHGFRYTARALSRHLEWRYHGNQWPHRTIAATELVYHMTRRINEASGLYQMFGVLGDVMVIRGDTVDYLEEVPLQSLAEFQRMTGHIPGPIIVFNFEYGKDYSGPGKDVLREDRANGDPHSADTSNFLHPVLYYYKKPPSFKWPPSKAPAPDAYHHVVEDFLTNWTLRRTHVLPLRRFVESILRTDLRYYTSEACFELILTHGSSAVPLACQQNYIQGLSISLSEPNHITNVTSGLMYR